MDYLLCILVNESHYANNGMVYIASPYFADLFSMLITTNVLKRFQPGRIGAVDLHGFMALQQGKSKSSKICSRNFYFNNSYFADKIHHPLLSSLLHSRQWNLVKIAVGKCFHPEEYMSIEITPLLNFQKLIHVVGKQVKKVGLFI